MKLIELLENAKNDIQALAHLNDQELKLLGENDFSSFINDDDKCAKFVELISKQFEIDNEQNYFKVLQRKDRASHSVSTWLMGISLNKYLNVMDFHYHDNSLLWQQTSVNHDYGYYLDEIGDEKLELSTLISKFDLLNDNYNNVNLPDLNRLNDIRNSGYSILFSYKPQLIRDYYNYKKSWSLNHASNNHGEINDHGIVGGCKLFTLYCENASRLSSKGLGPSITQMEIKKISCYNIASHNIYKSENESYDILYEKFNLHEITSKTKPSVKKENSLLMLLSLVDTLECYKRFSRKDNLGINHKTILNNVDISFPDNRILINFNDLREHIQKTEDKSEENEKLKVLSNHIKSIVDLNKWTEFKTEKINDFSVLIWL